ncbi:MAG TPA: glycosyltransferase [Candidatus Omnitrophota bacterium]|nr:glycosyltransferase [Candidatus Omnitrophota bacterium]
MKILYCAHGHYWDSTWPYAFIDGYITESLKQMGHEVKVYDIFARANTVIGFVSAYAKKYNLNNAQTLALLDDRSTLDLPLEVIEFDPDLVLHIVGRLPERVLKAVRKLGKKTAIWFLDDPQEIDKTAKMGLNYDRVFTVESACVNAHRAAGSSGAEFLPLACVPEIHKKMEVDEKYRSDICLIGVPFPRRVEIVDSLADFLKQFNVKIIGGGPNIGSSSEPWMWKRKLKRLDVLDKFVIDEVVHPDEAVKYYNGAKINLNIHRAAVDERFEAGGNSARILPRSESGRTFEVAGCGAFQLIDQERPDFRLHFEEAKEIVSFSDLEDFKKKVEYYLSHGQERSAIADAAQKRAYKEHTYKERLGTILKSFK